ncbi:MAG: hypothetical protein RMM58_09815 [Chloroflexota bacterium]|nr:hypothetical protein [Dehalococcoidia bacterium]MDW8254165.1 hypothetical protein [Chloroflexota bacterium]
MRWPILFSMLAALLFPAAPPSAAAQSEAVWVRGFPQRLTPQCEWYVALWSDGSYSATPFRCEPGIVIVERVVRDGITVELSRSSRSYPQLTVNGCVEYVTLWSDGSASWVPVSCPPGVTYFKSQAGLLDPAIERVELALEPAQPLEPGQRYRSSSIAFAPQCGFTLVRLAVVDAGGQPINGERIQIDWDGRLPDQPMIITNPTGAAGYEPGWTDASLSGRGMVIGRWRAWMIDGSGVRVSDIVTFETNNDCESPQAKQIVTITFRRIS